MSQNRGSLVPKSLQQSQLPSAAAGASNPMSLINGSAIHTHTKQQQEDWLKTSCWILLYLLDRFTLHAMQSALLYPARGKCHTWDSNVYEEEEKEGGMLRTTQ
jgi:hypothetical protein